MAQYIGRNDPCPCHSGRKYKHCCLQKLNVETDFSSDPIIQKLRYLEGKVMDTHLITYLFNDLPKKMIEEATEECLPEEFPSNLDKDIVLTQFFIPWLLFNWIPNKTFGVKGFDPEKTISENYLAQHSSRLDADEKRFIETINTTYYSYYSILQLEPEKSILLKDILLGTTHTVREMQATRSLKRGDIVLSRLLTLDGDSIFVGMMPCVLSADCQTYLIDFKEWLIKENEGEALTPIILRKIFQFDLIDYFFETMTSWSNAPMPVIYNTDDELMVFSKAYFKLKITPSEALDKLHFLALLETKEEILKAGTYDKQGLLKTFDFRWVKHGNAKNKDWDNTVMGDIRVNGDELLLETNSIERADKGKKILLKHLGNTIELKRIVNTSQDEMAAQKKGKDALPDISEIVKSPEGQMLVKQLAEEHWEKWFTTVIPALNDQTPLQASETPEGRERLEAVLLTYEKHDTHLNNLLRADIPALRKKLGLDVAD
jgi:hypothetical protein